MTEKNPVIVTPSQVLLPLFQSFLNYAPWNFKEILEERVFLIREACSLSVLYIDNQVQLYLRK